MPYHAGSQGAGTSPLPATALADRSWWREQLAVSRALHGTAPARVLGTIRWYSASSVLLAPVTESLAATGIALDPALRSTRLHELPDGRFPGASADRVLGTDPVAAGRAVGEALAEVVDALSPAIDAPPPALWAIATDSLANRLLWAGMATGAPEHAEALAGTLAEAAGERLPPPRYVDVGRSRVVRRASCCLVYEATDEDKCTSCPRQTPEDRDRRIRMLMG
ncbi:Fe-S oxidoreductase [Amycolatopsis antarctica]|uniref:Fe-S oxidoreductase n=2 Tax=Amycolatopsis antarctica TaxID=1854586 RepID=A0A263D7R3_9PSEU|nr:Fe-S oxidoreductase [Amycolatopsis antarctica]